MKCETLDNHQDPKIKRKFSVILVAVLIFMVKDGALGVDNVRDTLELRNILEVSIEEKRNISISDEDFPVMISDAQIELLFLAFGFTISAVLLSVSSTTVICLLGTLAAVSSISLSLLFLNLDNFARFEGGQNATSLCHNSKAFNSDTISLISSFLTCVSWSLLTLAGVAGVVHNFQTRRLSILALLMALGFVGEILFRKLNIFLLKHFGYNITAGTMIGFILLCGFFGSVLKSPQRQTTNSHSFCSSVFVLTPNLIGSFLFSLGIANIFNNFFPEDVNVPVMNISIILGKS